MFRKFMRRLRTAFAAPAAFQVTAADSLVDQWMSSFGQVEVVYTDFDGDRIVTGVASGGHYCWFAGRRTGSGFRLADWRDEEEILADMKSSMEARDGRWIKYVIRRSIMNGDDVVMAS